ncbi:MAG: AsmA family protein [Desulfobacterales bacterium]|nr:MAG: AsmA family protein [Desulfobacterales bacterium]
MKNFIKWGAIIIGCLVVVIIAALLLIPMFVDVQKYKPLLESKVSEATGRPFSVGDDLQLSLFPWAGVSFSDLRLGNPAGFSEKEFVTVKSFEVRIKLLPLLSKDVQIKRFVLNAPHIVLVKNKDGRTNWEQPKQPSKETPTKKEEKTPAGGLDIPIKALTVGNLAVNNGSLIWVDHASGTRQEILDLNLTLADVSMERPVKMTFSALLDQKPVSMEGTIGPLGQGFMAPNIPVDLSLNALKQLALRLKGSLQNPLINPGVDMDIEVTEFSPRKLVAELGQEFPLKTSDPKALSSVALKSHVKADARKVSISNGTIKLDQSNLTFSATAAEFSRPNLKFDLDLDQIDLDRYLPPPSEQPPPEKGAGPGKPAGQKIDYTPLRRMILDGKAKVGNLTVSKARIQDVLLQIKAKDGIIQLDPMQLKMYQGSTDGKVILNVAGDTPKSDLNLKINGIQVNPLLKDVLAKDFLEGNTNADIQLSMVGDQPDQVKKTLTGKGDLRFNDGAIVGIDLASMARNIGSAFGLAQKGEKRPRTDFTELAVPFTIKNGVANTPETSLKSPFIRIIATGTADLVKETLDFRVAPKAVASIKGQGDEAQRSGIMVPVLVSGTFSEPKFRPDLSAAAKEKIEKQIFESKEAQKLLDKEELKPLEKSAKDALKGLLGD